MSPDIVIVGSGHSVLDHDMGGVIDGFDMVVRFNNAGSAGDYSAHVGNRMTDLVFNCRKSCRKRAIALAVKHPTCKHYLHVGGFGQKRCSAHYRDTAQRIVRAGAMCCIAPDSLKTRLTTEMQQLIQDQGLKTRPKRLTAGVVAVGWYLEKFPESTICVYGFDALVGAPRASHYYGKGGGNLTKVHNPQLEARWMRLQIEAGRLHLLTDWERENL